MGKKDGDGVILPTHIHALRGADKTTCTVEGYISCSPRSSKIGRAHGEEVGSGFM